jgi:hypothetical protein
VEKVSKEKNEMTEYQKGCRDTAVIILLIVGVYLCKVNFQYNESHYSEMLRRIINLENKK